MTDQYVQSIDVEVGKAAKYMQWAGIALILASLGFILLSAFYSWWFVFGFVALMAAGGVFCISTIKPQKSTRTSFLDQDFVSSRKTS